MMFWWILIARSTSPRRLNRLPNARWVALRLLDGDHSIAEALRQGELGDLRKQVPLEVQPDHQIALEVA